MEAARDGFVRVIYYVTAVAIASCSYWETGFHREAHSGDSMCASRRADAAATPTHKDSAAKDVHPLS